MDYGQAYSVLLLALWTPLILPFVFVLLKRRTIDRKAAFVLVGVLMCAGVVSVSMFLVGPLIAVWLGTALGFVERGQVTSGDPEFLSFSTFVVTGMSLGGSIASLFALAYLLSPRSRVVRTSSLSDPGRKVD